MDSKNLDKPEVNASADEKAKKYMEKFDQLLLTDSDDDFPDIECTPCGKLFPTVQMFEQHLNSRKHYKMLNKKRSMQKLGPDVLKKKSVDDPLNSDSGDELYCDVCDKEMSGYTNYMAHMKGSVHAKNLKQLKFKEKVRVMEGFSKDDLVNEEEDDEDSLQKPFARCSTCSKSFSGPESYQQHLKGANHKKKLRHLKVVESLKKGEIADENGEEDNDGSYRTCQVCSKSFSGPVPYKMHLMSAVHDREVQRAEAGKELEEYFEKDEDGGKLVCKECKKAFTDPLSLKSHLANNSHGKQRVKDVMFGFVAANPEIVAVKSVQNLSSDEETEEKENFQNGHYFLVCKLCHVSLSGPESARDHLQSKKHLKTKQEKAERKILSQKLKDKQNGRPVADSKTSEIADVKNKEKESSTSGKSNGSVPNQKQTDTSKILESKIQEDFEFL